MLDGADWSIALRRENAEEIENGVIVLLLTVVTLLIVTGSGKNREVVVACEDELEVASCVDDGEVFPIPMIGAVMVPVEDQGDTILADDVEISPLPARVEVEEAVAVLLLLMLMTLPMLLAVVGFWNAN